VKTTYLLLFSLIPTLSLRAENWHDHAEGASARFGSSLTIREVTRSVLASNPAVKEAEKKWEGMKDRIPQAAAWDDPKLSASSRLGRFVSVSPNAFMDQAVSIEQMLPISGKNRSRARIAAAEALSAFEDVRRQQIDVLAKARASFFRLTNAYAQLELNRKNLVSLKDIAEISRSRYAVGAETAADALVAETEASKLLESAHDLLKALAAEQSQINVLMNRDAFSPLAPPVDAEIGEPNLSITRLRALTLANRPEVRIAAAAVEAQKARLQLAYRDWIPDPAVSLQAQRYNAASQAISELDAGISFTLPWGNHRKHSSEVHEAEENLDAAREALARAQTESVGLLRDALDTVETKRHHVELFRDKIVPQARQAFVANQLSYTSGKAGFSDWITAERNLRDLESMARQHLSDYQAALAELEAVVGADLSIFPPESTGKDTK